MSLVAAEKRQALQGTPAFFAGAAEPAIAFLLTFFATIVITSGKTHQLGAASGEKPLTLILDHKYESPDHQPAKPSDETAFDFKPDVYKADAFEYTSTKVITKY